MIEIRLFLHQISSILAVVNSKKYIIALFERVNYILYFLIACNETGRINLTM